MTQHVRSDAYPLRPLIEEAERRLRAVFGADFEIRISSDGRVATARIAHQPLAARIAVEGELVDPRRHAENLAKFLTAEQVAERLDQMLRADGRAGDRTRPYVRLHAVVGRDALCHSALLRRKSDHAARVPVATVEDAIAFLLANARQIDQTAAA